MKEVTVRLERNILPLQDVINKLALGASASLVTPMQQDDGTWSVMSVAFEEQNTEWLARHLHSKLRLQLSKHVPQ